LYLRQSAIPPHIAPFNIVILFCKTIPPPLQTVRQILVCRIWQFAGE
jgi:hypothetical protein